MEISLQIGSHSLEATLTHYQDVDYLGRGILMPEVTGVWVMRNGRERKLAKPSAKLCDAILKSLSVELSN